MIPDGPHVSGLSRHVAFFAGANRSIAARLVRVLLLTFFMSSSAVRAADDGARVRELWAGTYECSANDADPARWPAYEARIQLNLEGRTARISKESARIRETLSGQVAEDGRVRLEGSGAYKGPGGPGWRYRFDGRFEGDHFEARGTMLTPGMGTRLRDCSMTLTRTALPPQTVARKSVPKPRAVPAPRPAPASEAPPAPAEEKQELPPAVQEALLPPFHAAVSRIDENEEKAAPGTDAKGRDVSADPAPAGQPFWRNPIVWSAVILLSLIHI